MNWLNERERESQREEDVKIQAYHLCSCQLEGISLGDKPGTGYDGLYLLDTCLYQPGTCKSPCFQLGHDLLQCRRHSFTTL